MFITFYKSLKKRANFQKDFQICVFPKNFWNILGIFFCEVSLEIFPKRPEELF